MSNTTPFSTATSSSSSSHIDTESQSPINLSQDSFGSVYSPQKRRVELDNYFVDDNSGGRQIHVWREVFDEEKTRLLTQQHSHFSWLYPTREGNVSRCNQHAGCTYLIRIARGTLFRIFIHDFIILL